MKKIIFAITVLLSVLSLAAQNKVINDPNAEVRPVRDFHAISVATGIKLLLTQGTEDKIVVSAEKTAYRDRIKTEIVDGVLKIYYENDHDWFSGDNSNKNLKVYVSCKTLDALHASSGARVVVDGTIKSSRLDLSFSSGAGFKGDIAVNDLTLSQSSGASSEISGTALNVSAASSSGSEIKAFGLHSDHCDAHVSSGGSIQVSVDKDLKAHASSGGHIRYKGNGMISSVSTSSGGKVSKE